MQDLSGQVAIVTGASRGIGADTARLFVEAGAQVALLARSRDSIEALARELGEDAIAIACDVSSAEDMAAAVDTCLSRVGRIDILVNNAGVIDPISRLAEADADSWARAININLTGVFNGMRAVLPAMRGAGRGTILTVGSGAAYSPLEAWSHYCASKAGAIMLTRCADLEERANGIRVLSLSPGTVATDMQRAIKTSGVNPVSELEWSDHVPPEWPARALLWMCAPEADDFLGEEVSLRDEGIRRRIGLT